MPSVLRHSNIQIFRQLRREIEMAPKIFLEKNNFSAIIKKSRLCFGEMTQIFPLYIKQIFVSLAAVLGLLAGSATANAQKHVPGSFMCSYYGETIDPKIKMTAADASAEQVIARILGVVGLKPNFEVRAANVPNAAAVVIKGKRYILYNPKFITAINSASGTNWAGISIIAHEIGHHLNGHTLSNMGSRPDIELEADEFSGFVMNKLGAQLTDAQAALAIAASLKASHTHPARKDRLTAIATGWKNAGGAPSEIATAKKKSITKPAIINPVKEPAIAEKYIAFDVNFNADPKGVYYITVRGNVVKLEGDSLYVIGRLGESNKRGYKLMLYDKSYNYLYVAKQGVMVNGNGKAVGRITQH
jgi:hypothetical protein